jgi:hypothetical protein
MRFQNSLKLLAGTWRLPLVGLAGTVAAISVGFILIGHERQWQTVWMSTVAGMVAVGLVLVFNGIVVAMRR